VIRPSHISTAQAKQNWLDSFRNTGIIRLACIEAKVSRAQVYNWRREDTRFASDWREAEQDACDALEAIALQRARSGLSDTLLIFLLKSRNPRKFDDRQRIIVDNRIGRMTPDEMKAFIARELGLNESPALEGELAHSDGD
jgi:hypothetical protein